MKHYRLFQLIITLIIMALIAVWALYFREYYMLMSVLIIVLSFIPVYIQFDHRRYRLRDVVLASVLIALAVIGRVAFFMLPNVKPMCAIVILSGICMGGDFGFIVGSLGAFISNIFFTQGVWTPFQMVSFGIIGFLSGLIFEKKEKIGRIALAVFGFICGCFIYGLLVEGSTLIFLDVGSSFEAILAVYISAIPSDLIHGLSTALILFFFGERFIRSLRRIISKYALYDRESAIFEA